MGLDPKQGETAAARIAMHLARLSTLSDAELLGALEGVEPFPELEPIDTAWDDPALWDRLGLMLAFADEIGRRALVDGIAPLYGLAPLDDPWELTQGIRHGPEQATKDSPSVLEAIMRQLAAHPRSGTRLWAARELGILRDERSLYDLRRLAEADPESLVREEAVSSLAMLAVANGKVRAGVTTAIHSLAKSDPDEGVRLAALDALGDLDQELAAPLRPQAIEPLVDSGWVGQASGPDGFLATRRILRALITGTLRNDRLDEVLAREGLTLAMTPGSGVGAPREPDKPADGSAPDWRAHVALWAVRAAGGTREPLGLTAVIDLRRASRDEVRARLVSIEAATA